MEKCQEATSIVVEYHNKLGEKITETKTGFHAVVFQHEIDHLEGKIDVDRIEDTATIMTEKEYQKRIVKKKKK